MNKGGHVFIIRIEKKPSGACRLVHGFNTATTWGTYSVSELRRLCSKLRLPKVEVVNVPEDAR